MRLCLESRRRSRRSPPPAKTWVTCWRTGDPRGSPSIFHEIYRPVSLLDGSVELAPLAVQLVHPAPQGSYLDGGQDTDLRPPVAQQPVRCRAHEGLEGPVTQRQGVAASQGVRERRLAVGERRGEVRPVDAPYIPLELGDQPLGLIEEFLGIFRRTLTLLDESALLDPPRICSIRLCRSALFARASASFINFHLLTSLLSPLRGSPLGRLCGTGV